MKSNEAKPIPPRRRLDLRRRLALAAVSLLILWAVHPPILGWMLQFTLTRMAAGAGLRLEVGKIESKFGHPLVFEKVRLRVRNSMVSRTAADAVRIEVVLNWPWRGLLGERRLIRSLVVEDLRGVFDFRSADPTSSAGVDRPARGGPARTSVSLQWLPEAAELRHASVEFLAPDQSYYLEDASAAFSEQDTGKFRAAAAEIDVGPVRERLGTVEGVTAWKAGTVYLADCTLRDGLKIENLQMHLARPAGLALGLEAAVFGGALRADVAFGRENRQLAVEAAVWASQVDAKPLSALLGLKGKAEGTLREGRFTFRGTPSRALDGQASLRIAADGFLWNQRGWESLTFGGNLIHRRLAVSDFELRQRENTLSGNGEVLVTRNWQGLAKAPFLLNLSASIKDLGALAGLLGPPFDQMSGRMSISSSVRGQDGRLSGFLTGEASSMGFRKHPIESGRIEVNFANNEAQVSHCEFWSGRDYLRGKGAIAITSPHNYSGEIQGRSEDLAAYLDLMRQPGAPAIYGGEAQLRWQGDGTISAHSGAFNVSLEKFVSKRTPGGLTGRFIGTYSPQNIHFSGFELEQGSLRFSTKATVAGSGIKLTDAILRAGGRDLAEGEIFLPVDLFAVASGTILKDAVHPDQETYARVACREFLELRDLLGLAGNDLPMNGKVRLDLRASGPPSMPAVQGKFEGRDLAIWIGNKSGPLSQLHATMKVADGVAEWAANVQSHSKPPLTLTAQTPCGLVQSSNGFRHWMNPNGTISGRLDIPGSSLEILRPLLLRAQKLEGTISGGVTASGTVSKPELNGRIEIADGRINFSPSILVIDRLKGSVKFESVRAIVERFSGDIGRAPVEMRGEISWDDFSNWKYKMDLTGKGILLANSPALRLRANVDLQAAGDSLGGSIAGSLLLLNGRFGQRLEITPLLADSPVDEAYFVPPNFESLVSAPLNLWNLDVTIKTESLFTLGESAAMGEIVPDLRLIGTAARPVPVGRIEVRNLRAYLPFTTLTVEGGHIDFLESNPWVPQLDLRGVAQALDYKVQVIAFGPLNERHFILRSDPPLSQESLVLLLTTGLPPGVYAGSGLGDSVLEADSQKNRWQIGTAPPDFQGARATLRGRFRLWQELSLDGERDGWGNSHAEATYRLRFR